MNVALVRGKFLNAYEMQLFEKLDKKFHITAFGSFTSYHDTFSFPVIKLPSPMDIPEFPYKMPILNRVFTDVHYLFGLEKKLRGFHLIHAAETYYHYTQQALNAKKKGYVKKVIATVLENIPFNNEGIWGRRAFKKRAREELDHIVALTNKTKDALIKEGTDPKKITVIGHAIDTKRFHPVHRRPRKLSVLFVGRLEEEKGIQEFIEVAKKLRDSAHFIVIGSGSCEAQLPKFIEQKIVSYENMPSVYQNADIFVAPSKPTPTWDEQYNTALLEAQASGLAIVTTQTGGIPQNVGDAAILVEPGNIKQLIIATSSFITENKKRRFYAKKARVRALDVHDSRKVAKRMGDLYDQVMSKK